MNQDNSPRRFDPNHEENRRQLEYAKEAIEEMVADAVLAGQSGTIAIEIPVKDGKLGKVKRTKILFQQQ